MKPPAAVGTTLLALAALLAAGCEKHAPATGVARVGAVVVDVDHDGVAAELEPFERSLRPIVKKRFSDRQRADHGADPVAVAVAGGGIGVLLAGDERLVTLSAGADHSRSTAPFPTSLAADGDRFVVGSAVSGRLQWFGAGAGADVDTGAAGVVALAAKDGVVDAGTVDGAVVTVNGGVVVGSCDVGAGLAALVRLPHHLVALSALEHRVVVFDLDDKTRAPRCASARGAQFKGLLYTAVAEEAAAGGAVDVVIGGIEDADLDRSGGAFGDIDSFVFGVHVDGDVVTRAFSTNVSEHGVVTPRVLVRDVDSGTVVVIGRGSGVWAWLDPKSGAVLRTANDKPGAVAAAMLGQTMVVANDLDDDATHFGPAIGWRKSDPRERLGERMVFTTAMAPQQSSTGTASRFTCEACHWKGGVDGRVHDTGRVDDDGRAVTATTKPLFGLFQNPPLFSRALDRTVSLMVHAEFKVANKGTPQSPWFDVAPGVIDGVAHPAQELRQAMVAFFAAFDPPPNARAYGRAQFDDDERAGAAVFAARCAGCHPARVFADDEDSVVDVEAGVFSGAAVFGRDGYEDTGVRPKVHPRGARPSSLRGISRKTPLLTNGAARDLPALLQLVRVVDGQTKHQTTTPTTGTPLSPEEQRALLSFLRLL